MIVNKLNYNLNYILCTFSCIISNLLLVYGLFCFILMLPYTEKLIRLDITVLDPQLICSSVLIYSFSLWPIFDVKSRPCGQFLGGLLAAQISGLLVWVLSLDPLWPLISFVVFWNSKLCPIEKILTWTNFRLFKSKLSASTAIVGTIGSTFVALHNVNSCPVMLMTVTLMTLVLGLNIQPYVDHKVMMGPTPFHNFLYVWKRGVKGKIYARNVIMRCTLISLSFVGLNPMVAFATTLSAASNSNESVDVLDNVLMMDDSCETVSGNPSEPRPIAESSNTFRQFFQGVCRSFRPGRAGELVAASTLSGATGVAGSQALNLGPVSALHLQQQTDMCDLPLEHPTNDLEHPTNDLNVEQPSTHTLLTDEYIKLQTEANKVPGLNKTIIRQADELTKLQQQVEQQAQHIKQLQNSQWSFKKLFKTCREIRTQD